MLSQMLSYFGKKLQSFQEKKKIWENISSHFDNVFSFIAVIFSIFLQFRQHFRDVTPLMLNFFGMIASDFTSQHFRLFCDKFGPFICENVVF